MAEADRRWDEAAERLRYCTEYAQSGLKGLFLANGASIVALLTFLGSDKMVVHDHRALWWSFAWFAVGISCALGAYLSAYISQELLMNMAFSCSRQAESDAFGLQVTYDPYKFERWGNRCVRTGVLLAFVSMICFLIGAFTALDAIT